MPNFLSLQKSISHLFIVRNYTVRRLTPAEQRLVRETLLEGKQRIFLQQFEDGLLGQFFTARRAIWYQRNSTRSQHAHFTDHRAQRLACLLANHGAVTVADTMARAYMLVQILEDGARTACLAKQILHCNQDGPDRWRSA